ncbi:oligopeptide:H+ symporter [Lysobacter sp. LF1]|uniref:Oligopeptide:H+ symporter n=1 Tax=Lysobacter stagni TaxID=3045172 RepID=A0ABT6XKY7_9GAMM|nr:oligopeptide:H+ symporter [Lysobacter sp. LF1]MDI9240831.1 oligopeptide:H+ symporter [Lysobacter sp. LF1]
MATTDLPLVRDPRDELFGHPKGVYVCFFTEMWERFSFYGMKALLLLYLLQHHRFGDRSGLDVLGAYGGLVYCLPVIGGLLADRYLGMRKAVVFGGLLLVAGHLGMAVEGHAASVTGGTVVRDEGALRVFYLSLALIILGVGFLKPNISTIVGRLYPQNDPRRDSGFSLFYAGINLGALFASLVCGYLGETLGWRWGFGAAGIGMLLGLAQFLWGQKYLHGHAEPPDPARLRERVFGLPREWAIYLGALMGLAPVAGLMWAVANGRFALGGEVSLALALMILVMLVVLGWFGWFVTTHCTPVQRHQMISLLALIFMALVFFTLYEQTYGSWVTFTDRMLTKDVFPSLVIREGTPWPWSTISLLLAPLAFVVSAALSDRRPDSPMPKVLFAGAIVTMLVFLLRDCVVLPQTAGSLTYLGALFLVLLAPMFARLWDTLDRRNLDPSKPAKSALGLLFAGLSFVPLAWAAQHAGETGTLASVWWLVLAYLVLEIGEMCLAPVGLAAVTQLSVRNVVSLMMGTWFLATAFSETLAALFGKLAALDTPEGAALDFAVAGAKYADLFWLMMWIGIGWAVLAFIASPLLRRMMHGVK